MGKRKVCCNGRGQCSSLHGERNIWGKLKLSMTDDLNTAGLDRNVGFTTYEYDPVIDKHYAKARFYDSNVGRMLAIDPVRRSLNGYHYCDNDPVDYVDPTGEVWNIIGGGLIGGLVGETFGFVSSAVSQAVSGQKVDWKKAVGSGVNGAITGAVQGALIGSGAGLGVSLAANFVGGTLGSAAEQQISTGRVDARKAFTSGLANAAGNAIYGTSKLTSFGNAFWRGMKAGAVVSGINYISDSLAPRQGAITGGLAGGLMGRTMSASYGWSMDPRSSCGATSPMISSITSTRVNGYQYSNVQKTGGSQKSRGFSFGGLVKEMLVGGLTGGFASGTFYGIDKATQVISGSIRNVWGSKSGSTSDELIHVYRGTDSSLEISVHQETGHLLSEATRVLYRETGNLEMAYMQSGAIHDSWLDIWWGSENYFAQAHGEFGLELPQDFGLNRTLMSVTTDPDVARYFAGPNGRVFEADIPRSQLIEQTLDGAGESEYLIRFGSGGFQ